MVACYWECNLGFPCGSAGKESACHVGGLGSIPGLGRSPGEGQGYPLQYSGLENSMDCIIHGVPKSQIGLSDFHTICKMERQGPWSKIVKYFKTVTAETSSKPCPVPFRSQACATA